jgi:hypothetical protein
MVFYNDSLSNEMYVALIIHNGASDYKLDTKLTSILNKLLGEGIMVMVNDVDYDGSNYYGSNEINESMENSDLKRISKLVSSLPRPDELIVDGKTGETNGDDFFWPIVEMLDYKSDNDYRRVKNILMDLYRFTGALSKDDVILFTKIMNFKNSILEKRHGDDIREVGDDSWGDLKADIVSRGKDFYNEAVSNFDLVQKMASDMDYSESFYYGIPYRSDLD